MSNDIYEKYFSMPYKKDKVIKRLKLNKPLVHKFINDLPLEFDTLEKIIYLYIKICQYFSYDEEYMVLSLTEKIKQKRIKKLKKIDLTKKDLVCYEFIAIFAKIVDMCFDGVFFQTYPFSRKWDEAKHRYLIISVEEYVLSFDPFETLYKDDTINATFNMPLKGIKNLVDDLDAEQKFQEKCNKVYNYIKKSENNFEETFGFINEIEPFLNKLVKLLDKALKMENKNIDMIGYLLRAKDYLRKNTKERVIDMIILRDNNPAEEGKKATASLLIVYNENGFDNDPEHEYLLYNSKKSFIYYEKEELKEMFECGDIENINWSYIPGLVNIRKIKQKNVK